MAATKPIPTMSSQKINPIVVRTWQAVAGELATHNGPVEIVPMTGQGESLPRFRTRLLRADAKDDSLIIETPSNTQHAQMLAKGVGVEVYLVTGSTRMKAASRVIDVGLFRLNKQTKVMAVRLEPMQQIASAQRRACFRLSTVSMGMSAKLRHQSWPASQRAISAKVQDLSDRGLGLTAGMAVELAQKMKNQVYRVVVPLPSAAESLELDARLVRVIETEFRTVTLGFQFEFENLSEQRRVERMVQQFSVQQQRKQLKRMRGVG